MKMKIPNEPTGNGYSNGGSSATQFEHHTNLNYQSDPSDTDEIDPPTLDGDFSEYLWMENEEEFDQQVLRQLEEEALMEQCIEAMLEDERESGTNGAGQSATTGGQSVRQQPQQQTWSTGDLVQGLDELCISGDVVRKSKLNPNAVEFVPRSAPTVVASSTG